MSITKNNTRMLEGTLGVDKLSATGTKDATTFLRGDNTFAAPAVPDAASNSPCFQVYRSSHQTVSSGVDTKFEGTQIEKDSSSAVDNTTNYRWTCPTGQGGTYLFWWKLFIHSNSNTINSSNAFLRKNGATILATGNNDGLNTTGNDETQVPITGTFLTDIAEGDYVELWGNATTSNTGDFFFISNSNGWGGMKLA